MKSNYSLDSYPKSSRTIRVSARGKQTTTPRIEKFKNPILGLEVNLMKQLQDVENEYHGASYKKREILLDTLEAVANTDLGFKRQILYALNAWRKPNTADGESNEVNAISDLLRAQNDYREVQNNYNNAKNKIEDLKRQIEETKNDTQRIGDETNAMKTRLFRESDHFAKARKLTEEMIGLKTSFDGMFQKSTKDEYTGKYKEMADENEKLKVELSRMRFELELCSQISKRMKFIEQKIDKK